MIQFAEILNKTMHVKFNKTDIQGYSVEGTATYDKNNELTHVDGTINCDENQYCGNFNAYKSIDNFKLNINDLDSGKYVDVCPVIESTIEDLKQGYIE